MGTLSGLELIAHRATLEDRERELETTLSIIQTEIKQINEQILREFQETGTQNAKSGGYTFYIHSQIWAKAVDGDKNRLIDDLKSSGYGEFITENYNSQTLSKFVRELDKGEDMLPVIPEGLKGSLTYSEDYSIRARKA